MKKLFLGLSIAFLASCTNNERVDIPQGQNSIKFKVPYVTNVTRTVTDVTTSIVPSIHAFGVYTALSEGGGYDWEDYGYCLENKEVTAESGFDTGELWRTNNVYAFAAYVNGADNTCLKDNAGNSLVDFSVDEETGNSVMYIPGYDSSEDNDLIVAMTNDIVITTASNVVVPLSFRHVLSKLNFIFLNGETSSYNMKVYDVELRGINKTGNVTITKQLGSTLVPVWTPLDGLYTKSFDQVGDVLAPKTSAGCSCYTIPGDIPTDCILAFKVTLNPGETTAKTEEYEVELNINTLSTWQESRSYSYTLQLQAHQIDTGLSESIKFSVAVDTWGPIGLPLTPTPKEE